MSPAAANPFGHIDLRVTSMEAALPSAAEVDRLAAVADNAGAVDISGPKPMPYSPGYYAVFFADPSGNLVEIYHRPPA